MLEDERHALSPALVLSVALLSVVLVLLSAAITSRTGRPTMKLAVDDADGPLRTPSRRDLKTVCLALLGAVDAAGWIVEAVRLVAQGDGVGGAAAALFAVGWTLSTVQLLVCSAPLLLFTFYLFHALVLLVTVSLPSFGIFAVVQSTSVPLLLAHGAVVLLSLALVTSFRLPSATPSQDAITPTPSGAGDEPNSSPEEQGTIRLRAWLTLSWIWPLLEVAQTRSLLYEDIWRLPTLLRGEAVSRSSREQGGRRLVDRLLRNNVRDLVCCLILGVGGSLLAYSSPYLLRLILLRFNSDSPNARAQGYLLALVTLFAQLLRATVDLQRSWHQQQVIVKVRTSIIAEVYVKGLQRRDASGSVEGKQKGGKDGPASTGRIVSMMNTDANKIANLLPVLISLASAPFELAIAITLLYRLLGWPSLAGVSVMAVTLPLNQILVRRRMMLHPHVLGSRDQRMEVLNEFVQAIRFIKFSASEKQWLARIDSAREEELKWLFRTRTNYMLMNCLWTFTPDVILLVAFACLTKVVGRELDISTAFASLGLFTLLRAPMALLPTSLSMITQTWITLQRLETLFTEPDVEASVSAFHPDAQRLPLASTSSPVSITGADFSYHPIVDEVASRDLSTSPVSESTPLLQTGNTTPPSAKKLTFELCNITIDFPVGKLTLVAGATGSGKTSLLLALLGEMYQDGGQVSLRKGSIQNDFDAETGLFEGVAYASQHPFLQHMSIKQNILFGSPFEQGRYSAVIDACALRADLAMFDAGDETEIGEKGISLSGGQKARVALARAVYSRAKTVFLDDPLSAVDSHTGKHLFHECLKGPLLENRTVILVTHHISLCLPGAFYLVRLAAGRVEAQNLVSLLDSTELSQDLQLETEAFAEVPQVKTLEKEQDSASKSSTQAAMKGDGRLVAEEKREEGRVKGGVYTLYLKAAGAESWILLTVLVLAGRLTRVLDRVWFKLWSESYHTSTLFKETPGLFSPDALHPTFSNLFARPTLPSASDSVNFYLAIYALISVLSLFVTVASIFAGFHGSLKASRTLFRNTTKRVSRASFRYFDTTPTGRLLSRFAGDFQTIDASIADTIRVTITHSSYVLISIAVICFISPAFILAAIVISFLYIRLSLVYVKCSRDLRRLEATARSPIFSKFGETLAGISIVRAFGAERRFLNELYASVDKMLAVNYASSLVNRWLIWRFDALGGLAIFTTTALALFGGASPGLAALAITSAQAFVQKLYDLCRIVSALEVDLNAVERVTELLNIPQDPPSVIEGKRPPAHWPSSEGGISVEDLVISYAPSLAPVVKGVSFRINPREKVAVVGRTGSGKSTLALSLLRFTEPTSGKILIDGIDITSVGTFDLRSRISYIAQESVLFSGTIRSNLDPFDEHTDQQCTDALARVHLSSAEPNGAQHGRLGVGLDSLVAAGGLNFSAGQRQLLAMARALLHRPNILIMDEATASVDRETDEKIQHTVRDAFRDCLVITIAHRLATVIDYDKVLVLEQGVLVEFDSPQRLLQREGGAFRRMCEQSADWAELRAKMEIEGK